MGMWVLRHSKPQRSCPLVRPPDQSVWERRMLWAIPDLGAGRAEREAGNSCEWGCRCERMWCGQFSNMENWMDTQVNE